MRDMRLAIADELARLERVAFEERTRLEREKTLMLKQLEAERALIRERARAQAAAMQSDTSRIAEEAVAKRVAESLGVKPASSAGSLVYAMSPSATPPDFGGYSPSVAAGGAGA